ncbi:hypothetical protein FOA43_004135 [Brettanomyces nanus]|uniref:non-specific serine/threonine protein kinase n=1 Tax=Eeniella nana TaxID=13502 RepID=A0A875S529_EENNA|nr:uncharacterized protein FOA43_004135 [Brettanomyces nanus]QPG76741.1 hypothetical protein FOA43_004135 [Brettanomyces nanus]
MSPPWQEQTIGCLKRVAVPSKPLLNILRQEVDAMRRLRGRKYIVSYIDSHARHAQNGQGYVVFLLMEYCARDGLIDFMNSRLVNKLTEPEILDIMGEICEAVACMHSLDPPIVHRDIKIENVLIAADGTYKLCDFGSASPPLSAAENVEDFQRLQDDILHHTTPQYRSPEMIDLYKRQPIDEKSDIWALGVMLYKLCYYTTPFEKNGINGNGNGGGGNSAILDGIYSFPPSPPYSTRLKNLIKKTLMVNPQSRPNIFQLLEETCKMRHLPYPDIYPEKHPSLGMQQSFTNISRQSTLPPLPTYPLIQTQSLASNVGYPPIQMNAYTHQQTPAATVTHHLYTTGDDYSSDDPFAGIHRYKTANGGEMNASTGLQNRSVSNNNMAGKYSNGFRKLSSGRRRPLSMSATEFDRLNNEKTKNEVISPIQSIITGMTEEEIVELSPNHHTNIDSSMEFLRDLSRQNSGFLNYEHRSKRSSMSSIKELLTGGKHTANRHSSYHSLKSVSSRKSSGHGSSSESLLDFSHSARHHEKDSNVHSSNPSVPTSHPPKRSNSIQKRVKLLLNRKQSPPPKKTASGYGKYTDESNIKVSNERPATFHDYSLPSATNRNAGQASLLRSPSPLPTSLVEEADPFSTSHHESDFQTRNSHVGGNLNKKKVRAPPPKPRKPAYLRSSTSSKNLSPTEGHHTVTSDTNSSLYDEDFEALEKKFQEKYPSAV